MSSATGRRTGRRAVLALLAALLVTGSAGCSRAEDPRSRPHLEGQALTAEVQRLEDAVAALPHVVDVDLTTDDTATNGQYVHGQVRTDTDVAADVTAVLDATLRIAWGTRAFVPGVVDVRVLAADGATTADYRALGFAETGAADAGELEERYGRPAFLTATSG